MIKSNRIIALVIGAALAITIPVAAMGATAKAPGGNVTISEQNGNYDITAPNLNAGTAVIQDFNQRCMHFNSIGGTYQGDDLYYVQFSNNNYLASSAGFGATIKSDASANGVVWAFHIDNGNVFLINRWADQQAGSHDNIALGGDDLQGHQWAVRGVVPGFYRALQFDPSC